MELTAKQSASLSPQSIPSGAAPAFSPSGQPYPPMNPQLSHDRLSVGLNRHHSVPVGYEGNHWPQPHEPVMRSLEQKQEIDSNHEGEGELKDINKHTNSIEFHGNTSSMSFLALVDPQNPKESAGPGTSHDSEHSAGEKPSLVNTLHNVAFTPDSDVPSCNTDVTLNEQGFYFRHAHVFLDGYFENLHFIHPFLEKEEFLSRCEDLWFGRAERQKKSFIALYYSILSLG